MNEEDDREKGPENVMGDKGINNLENMLEYYKQKRRRD